VSTNASRFFTRRAVTLLGAGAALLLALPGLMPGAQASGPFVQWDRRNDGPINANTWNTASSYVAFTPTHSAFDTVQLCIAGDTSDVRVVIREGSDSEPIVGTSGVETTLPGDGFFSIVFTQLTFTFDDPVALTPGETYVIDTAGGRPVVLGPRTARPGQPVRDRWRHVVPRGAQLGPARRVQRGGPHLPARLAVDRLTRRAIRSSTGEGPVPSGAGPFRVSRPHPLLPARFRPFMAVTWPSTTESATHREG